MGKSKKKSAKEPVPKESCPTEQVSVEAAKGGGEEREEASPAPPAVPQPPVSLAPAKARSRRLWPDLIKGTLALAVVALGAIVWYKPLLISASFPYVSYTFGGQTATDARLYRPLAMPTRYYIELPRQLADRYVWFAVDRRREVVALAEEPSHRFLGRRAIKRSDSLGLDLEFRKLDHSEWQVHFLPDAIVFSNAVLTIRMDTIRPVSNDSR